MLKRSLQVGITVDVEPGGYADFFSPLIAQAELEALALALENVSTREASLYQQLDVRNRENAAQRALIGALKDLIEQTADRETDVCDLLAEQEKETRQAHARAKELASEAAGLQNQLQEVEQELDTTRTYVRELEQHLAAFRAQADQREQRIHDLTHSLSWRLTAPIRLLGRPMPAIASVVRRAATLLW